MHKPSRRLKKKNNTEAMSHIVRWDTDRYTAIPGKSIMQSPIQSRDAAIAGMELSSTVNVKSSRNEDISLKLKVKEELGFCHYPKWQSLVWEGGSGGTLS